MLDEPIGMSFSPYSIAHRGYDRGWIKKIFDPSRQPISGHDFSFPFIDVLGATIRDGSLCHESIKGGVDMFPLKEIFPLKKVKFGPTLAYVPNDPERVVIAKYGSAAYAVPADWDHRNENVTRFPQTKFDMKTVLDHVKERSTK
jgi:hypothetical protein